MNKRTHFFFRATPLLGLALFAACSGQPMQTDPSARPMGKAFDPAALPAAVQVPPGHVLALQTVGRGDITYECREKAAMAGEMEWVFVGPAATLMDRQGKTVGRYFGPPATWAAADGSAITGTQLAVAPAGTGNIPLQLVKANPATGMGLMSGISHIQRVATQGGVAPSMPCTASTKGQRQVVAYQADYIFWKAA